MLGTPYHIETPLPLLPSRPGGFTKFTIVWDPAPLGNLEWRPQGVKGLTRISHHFSTAVANPLSMRGRTLSSHLDIVSLYALGVFQSVPSLYERRLDALAPKTGEKYGLSGPSKYNAAHNTVVGNYRDIASHCLHLTSFSSKRRQTVITS